MLVIPVQIILKSTRGFLFVNISCVVSAVFFQFCDAGGNGEAAKLVAELEKNQEIRPHIHCEPGEGNVSQICTSLIPFQ
jgi:hypothetical protein